MSRAKGIGKEYEKEEQGHSIFSVLELARDKFRKIEKYRVAFSEKSKLLELATLRATTLWEWLNKLFPWDIPLNIPMG